MKCLRHLLIALLAMLTAFPAMARVTDYEDEDIYIPSWFETDQDVYDEIIWLVDCDINWMLYPRMNASDDSWGPGPMMPPQRPVRTSAKRKPARHVPLSRPSAITETRPAAGQKGPAKADVFEEMWEIQRLRNHPDDSCVKDWIATRGQLRDELSGLLDVVEAAHAKGELAPDAPQFGLYADVYRFWRRAENLHGAYLDRFNDEVTDNINDLFDYINDSAIHRQKMKSYLYATQYDDYGTQHFDIVIDLERDADWSCVMRYVADRKSIAEQYEDFNRRLMQAYTDGSLLTDEDLYWELMDLRWDLNERAENRFQQLHSEWRNEKDGRQYGFYALTEIDYPGRIHDLDTETAWYQSFYEDSYYAWWSDLGPYDCTIAALTDKWAVAYTLNIPETYNGYTIHAPQKWILYGCYSPDATTPDLDIDREGGESTVWQMIDYREGEQITEFGTPVRFELQHPGVYNRFNLRLYKNDDFTEKDVRHYIAISEMDIIEGSLSSEALAATPDPELPHFIVETNTISYPDIPAVFTVKTDIGSPTSAFRMENGGQATIRVVHADPQYGARNYNDFEYAFHNRKFEADGTLSLSFRTLFDDTFPLVPGHVCDYEITVRAMAPSTGRYYTVKETIPVYLKDEMTPVISGGDWRVYGTTGTATDLMEVEVDNINFDEGYTLHVEIDDYTTGSYATRSLDLDDETGQYMWEYLISGCEWAKIDVYEGADFHFHPTAHLSIPVCCREGGKDAHVRVTATNRRFNLSSTWEGTATYEAIDLATTSVGTYTVGRRHKTAPRPLQDWTDSNAEYLEEFDRVFTGASPADLPLVEDALRDLAESTTRTLHFTYPHEWGECRVGRNLKTVHTGESLQLTFPNYESGTSFRDGKTTTLSLSWPKIGAELPINFTSVLFPEDYAIFAPRIEGADGQQSVSVYVNNGLETATATGRFGSEDPNPEWLFFKTSRYFFRRSTVCFRDNSTKVSTYYNKAQSAADDYVVKPLGIPASLSSWITANDVPSPVVTVPINEGIISYRPTRQLMLIDENGAPFSSYHTNVKVSFVRQPANGIIPFGTSPDFNPFVKGETISTEAAINGIIEFDVPLDDDGLVSHPIIEISDDRDSYNGIIDSRIISPLTTPEAFTDYFDKGLPYPCVIHTSSKRRTSRGCNLWVRSTDTTLMGDERVAYPLGSLEQFSYNGTDDHVDVFLANSTIYEENGTLLAQTPGQTITLADGTTEQDWAFNVRYKIFAPRRAVTDTKEITPYYSRQGTYWTPDLVDDMEVRRDDNGRSLFWPKEMTGFKHNYTYLTCQPSHIIENMRKNETAPHNEMVSVGEFLLAQLNSQDKPLDVDFQKNSYYSFVLGRGYNNMVEEVDPEGMLAGLVGTAAPNYDGGPVAADKDTKKVGDGLDLEIETPSCLPFVNVLVTATKGEYRIRSSFEVNALDFILPQNEAMERVQAMQQRINDVGKYMATYLRIMNACRGDYTTDIFDMDDGAFVGFKGFTEMAVIKDFEANKWTPYFTGLGAKFEASMKYSWKLQAPPFLAKMSTRAEVSSSFLMLNPHPSDFALKQAALDPKQGIDLDTFNPYSHFNLYVGSAFDLSLCLQAGIGFDAGFIAAHGGLMGKARAAARFAYVNRPYLSGGYTESAGARYDLSASLSAYAYFKFLFLKYTKEWPLCHAEKTYFSPDNNWNPLKTDPNLNPELAESNARVRIRPLTATYVPQRKKVSVIGSRTISDNVDIFANPIYLDGGQRLALFHLGNPSDPNDDRVFVSGKGCNTNDLIGMYADDVPAFTYHAASAGDYQVVAVQRLAQRLTDTDSQMADAAALTDKLQIVASIGDNAAGFVPNVISTDGTANTDPHAAIDNRGFAAVVWASGDINVHETTDADDGTYHDPQLTGNIVISHYDSGYDSWSKPICIVGTSPESQVKDYAVAVSGRRALVMASVPATDAEGNATAPVFVFASNGSTVTRTALGIEGAQHQIVTVGTGHFIASTLVTADGGATTDIQLFDITITPDGTIRHTSLGRLGLNRHQIMSYRLVSPKDGATGVDGLGIIWNQHEQDNTDDETLDATPYNRSYVARINRRADYIYLSHAAQALELPDDMSVADMTAYMSDDASLACPVVTAAFCIGETQKDGASTAAEIIEKKVSLNNEFEWLESASGLSNIIDHANGTEIKLAFRNKGLHTIRRFTIRMAGSTFEQKADVAPSSVGTVTITLPAKTDFSDEIPFTVDADFYDIDLTDPADAGVLTETVSLNGAFKVNVVDMCTSLTLNRIDRETRKDVVIVSISNLSPMALKPGNSVKVSLFTDALGDTQYPGVQTYTIPASELYNSETRRGGVKTLSFYVTAPATRTTVYAIVRTVDSDGNVVFDQNSTNDVALVTLAPASQGEVEETTHTYTIGQLVRLIDALKKNAANPGQDHTTPDQDYNNDSLVTLDDVDALVALIAEITPDRLTVSDLTNPQLKVTNAGRSITVEGLNPEKDLKVFDSTGRLLKWTEPAAESATVEVEAKGTLIIVNDGKAGIIRH